MNENNLNKFDRKVQLILSKNTDVIYSQVCVLSMPKEEVTLQIHTYLYRSRKHTQRLRQQRRIWMNQTFLSLLLNVHIISIATISMIVECVYKTNDYQVQNDLIHLPGTIVLLISLQSLMQLACKFVQVDTWLKTLNKVKFYLIMIVKSNRRNKLIQLYYKK